MKAAIFLMILVLAGCAEINRAPTSISSPGVESFQQPRLAVIGAAKRALEADGYRIANADDMAGTISTEPRNVALHPKDAYCAPSRGFDYLEDSATTTQVSMKVLVKAKQLIVKADIQGEYKPSPTMASVSLFCLSSGELEADMIRKIMALLR